MSAIALGWAKQQQAPSALAKAVLICLADYADADGLAWPKIGTLAAEVQASERTVQRCIRALEEAGLVTREDRFRADQGQTSNGYKLPLPGDSLSPSPRQDVTPPVTLLSPLKEQPVEPTPSDEGVPAAPKVKGRRKPSVRIPPDTPSPSLIAEQQAKMNADGFEIDVSSEAERFRNHAEQTDRTCANWDAAFRNWVIKAKGWAPRKAAPGTMDDTRWQAALALHREEGRWSASWGPKPGEPGCRVPPHLLIANDTHRSGAAA
jgi:hypothetical protein